MKIAFCSSEVVPFAQTGGLGDVIGALPLALEKLGEEIFIFLPRYKCVNVPDGSYRRLSEDIISTTIGQNIQVFFIENEKYFNRDGLYGDAKSDYPDNLERFQYYCQKTLESLKRFNIKPEIVHCHDWQTSLIPVYLKTLLKDDLFYRNIKSILTIHNLAYQGVFPSERFSSLGLDQQEFICNSLEFQDQINLLKAGILFGDIVTTVSRQYAKEIQSAQLGCGLDEVLHQRGDIIGILNGVNYEIWDPETDEFIEHKYSPYNIKGKYLNKRRLQQKAKLPEKEDIPLFGFVGRLSWQKGVDLLAKAMEKAMELDIQIIFLGTGEEKYHRILQEMSMSYLNRIFSYLSFDETIAHNIYAGSDIFLMPSQYEPCGLSQMISLKYGTIPLVFETGGLSDTVRNFDVRTGDGNGFVFTKYNEESFVEAVKTSVKVYQDKEKFNKLMQTAFQCRFPWEDSAQEYKKLYRQCLS